MTDPIEIMARAICIAKGHDPDEEIEHHGDMRLPHWTLFAEECGHYITALEASGRYRIVPVEPDDASVADLKYALFLTYNVLAMTEFEPDSGRPHPMRDGTTDRVIRRARELLRDYVPPTAP